MKLELTDDDEMLADSLERLISGAATSARVRAAEEGGLDQDLWRHLCELGMHLLRVPADHGGADGTLLHALIAAETAGRHLAPVPLIESIVGLRLLAQLDEAGAALVQSIGAEGGIATIALADVGAQPRQIVPAGAVASVIICLDREGVGILQGFAAEPLRSHGSQPLARIDFRSAGGTYQLLNDPQARRKFLAALEEYKLLQAALIASAARRSVELAAQYANERVAFGRPIGGFQAVAHPLANAVTDADGALLLARRAADAVSKRRSDAAAMVSMASVFARKTGPAAALKAMRVLGGYGMSMEYDAQLYYQRVNAWSLLRGSPDAELDTVADRLWGGESAELPETDAIGLDFDLSPEAEAVADRARAFAACHIDDARREFIFRSLDTHQPEFNQLAAQEGLHMSDWAADCGGPGMSGEAAFGVKEAFSNAGFEDITAMVTDIAGKTVALFGGERLKREVLPALASGEKYCSLGYSEPSGGSDVFGAKTLAVRDGDNWIINGQKIFTSLAHIASYVLLLARTDPSKPKHEGLTLFVVPLDQPGFQVSEIHTISEERTNVTFYENMVVPDEYRVGEVNGALRAMAKALEIEQSGGDLYTHGLKVLLDAGLRWARDASDGPAPIEDRSVKRLLAEIATHVEAQDVLVRRCIWAADNDKRHKSYGPMSKLFGSEAWMEDAHALMALAGPWSLERRYSPLGEIEKQARRSIPATIYAGTSEIQRSIIAESALGLPRSR